MAAWGDKRPRAYVCYLCGAQFGSASLHIHLPQCADRFLATQEQLPPRERRAVPPPPPELPETADGLPKRPADIDAFNARMFEAYNEVSLTRCGGCGRTFEPGAYARHVNVCKGRAAGGAAAKGGGGGAICGRDVACFDAGRPEAGSSGSGPGAPAPKTYMCYACGREFGSASLLIHVPRCEQLHNERLTAGGPGGGGTEGSTLAAPKPLPPRPEALSRPLPKDAAGIEAFNSEMRMLYEGASLLPCSHCGRTFFPEALARHAAHCTAEAPMARGGRGSGSGSGTGSGSGGRGSRSGGRGKGG